MLLIYFIAIVIGASLWILAMSYPLAGLPAMALVVGAFSLWQWIIA